MSSIRHDLTHPSLSLERFLIIMATPAVRTNMDLLARAAERHLTGHKQLGRWSRGMDQKD
jgi:hypothetical protein